MFKEDVLELIKSIPEWRVVTYKSIAEKLWNKAYRAVWTALNKNPNPIIVPCHRVVNSSWEIWWYAFGVDKKIEILKKEWVFVENWKVINFKEKLYRFK